MIKEELVTILANIPPFNKLNRKGNLEFARICEVKEYQNAQTIYREGDAPGYFYLLLRGRVVALTSDSGIDSEIELLKRGTSFGVISLFTDEPHSVTTQSIEDSIIIRVERSAFKGFLEKYPVISLDFSRILSSRVKRRKSPKKIFQCKRIGVIGYHASGKTNYTINLSRQLKKQTKKNVICVEIRAKDDFTTPSLINADCRPLVLKNFNEDQLCDYIAVDEVDHLLVQVDSGSRFFAILNRLSESYHFVICELSCKLLNDAFSDFIYRADSLHLIFLPIKEDLAKGGKFISDLSERELLTREKIRVIINEFSQGQKLDCEKTKALKHPVYATIPKSDSPHYHKVFKRIARQIGEVRLGVALGSGGSYGFAHIGVLEVLEENNIDIDIICGSSMGSLVAAMWAAGFSVDKMKQVAANFGKKLNLFSFPGFYFPFKGIIKAKRSEKIYKEIFGGLTFHDLKHDLKLASFDFYKRKAAVLDEGLLYKAVAASCAIPGVFEPVKMKKNLMLDGGVLNPLPSKILLNYGVNKIIAINVTPPLEKVALRQKIKGKWHIFDFIFGTIETMQREFIDAALKVSDVVIHPVFEATDWAHFENVDEYIEAGRKAALGKLNDIKELSER